MEFSGEIRISAVNPMTAVLESEWVPGPVWILCSKKTFCRLWGNKLYVCLPNTQV